MLTFDKLKLVTKIDYIQIDDIDRFQQIITNNTLKELKYNITSPYLLYIEIDYLENELVIEFSGKILGSDYKKLISTETIRQCFENINSLEICTLDVEAILTDAIVVKCDVTKDVNCTDVPSVSAFVRDNVRRYRQFLVKSPRNKNLIIEKNVETKGLKKRLTIYDKGKEMHKMDNQRFMEKYEISAEDFKDICRFEMNLNSIAQIKASLNITDTQLMTVLTADGNPIAEFMDEIVTDGDSIPLTDKQTYMTALVLRDCNYDLAEVEEKMRQIYSKGTNISKIMKPYKEAALAKNNKSKFTKTDLLQMLR